MQTVIEEQDKIELMSDSSERIIGKFEGKHPGPVLIALSAVHGNEPTGIVAIEHVMEHLKGIEDHFHGTLIGIRGNLKALKSKVRFIDEDMNRIWFTSILDKVRRTPYNELKTSERKETKAVLEIIDPIILAEEKPHPVIFADFHTFSSQNGLFVISSRASRNVELLEKLRVPLIFGIEKALHGTALKYVQNADNIGFAFESGLHYSESSEFNAIAGLYSLLVASGCLEQQYIDDFDKYHLFLEEQTRSLPQKVEFVYKHIIEEDDEFEMMPGFKNFDRVMKGDRLATDRHGEIEAQSNGYILMPLYQKQGSDGFFIVKDLEEE